MIRVDGLSKTYDRRSRGAKPALCGVSFTLPDTGFICITGPSGCGKTSLLNAIGGLDTFDGGTVSTERLSGLRCGARLTEAERNHNFGYVFQNYYLLPEYSVGYNVYLGLHALELSHGEKLKRVMEALRAVDMERFARRAVGQLSGGQQQRVAIARALARRPRVIFADEPTGNLDEANTMNICALLRRISRDSLVVMVTHEERIARFFADRIIALREGRLAEDSEDWCRTGYAGQGGAIYTDEFHRTTVDGEGFSLRLLREEGAPPVELTLVVQQDRVVIKLDDPRTVVCGRAEEPPQLVEGARPVLRLEDLEQDAVDMDWSGAAPCGRSGRGITLPVILREGLRLFRGKGVRQAGSRFFLAVLTMLTLLAVGDYLKVASIEPEEFITADSHLLEFHLDRGRTEDTSLIFSELIRMYPDYLDRSGLEFDYLPHVSASAEYFLTGFLQLGSESEILTNFSYVLLSHLDESELILGRMPRQDEEIVVDRWVLEELMEREGIVQNGINDVSDFLGERLTYSKKNYAPVIVGICDSGEPAVYLSEAALVSIGNAGNQVISLSALQALFPGEFDDYELAADECIMVVNNAGQSYAGNVGGVYLTNSKETFTIEGAIEADTYASVVVADGTLSTLLRAMTSSHFFVYCGDKEAMADYLAAGMPEALEEMVRAEVTDRYAEARASYEAAATLRLDGRRIVTLSILVLSMIMLYLLQRSKVQERLGMAAVYRLLGIPGRKLAAIFAVESLLSSLTVVLPCTVLFWAGLHLAEEFPSVELNILLPWYGGAAVFGGILVYHLVTSLLPLFRLLRLPPARLASRYDI